MADLTSFYSNALGQSQANYANVLGAYSAGQSNLSSQLPGIAAGYGALSSQVGNTLGMGQVLGQNGNWGVAAPAATAIQNQMVQQQAQNRQQLIQSGLGNSTVLGNLNDQTSYQAQQALGSLGANLAGQYAGFQSNIGLAGQAAQMQGLGLQTNLYGQQGSTLGNYRFPIPPLGGGGGGGGFGGYAGAAGGSTQGLPLGGQFGGGVAGPGASGYSGGAGASGLAGYSPYGGIPNAPGTTVYPSGDPNQEMDPNDPYNPYGNNYAGSAAFSDWYGEM